MKRHFRKTAGRGSIVMIALLFTFSAGVRIATSADEAMAQVDLSFMNADAPDPAETEPASLDRAEIQTLLDALNERERRVADREEQAKLRTRTLEIATQEVERRLEALEQAEARLRATLAQTDTAAEDDLTRLTDVYQNMKPKDAARLFEAMEPEFAAGFLGRMRPDAAAAIMAGLDPQIGYSISVILAGRNANTPKS
ncbi:MAG: MotE family protein [Paracoccaceae bacterium]